MAGEATLNAEVGITWAPFMEEVVPSTATDSDSEKVEDETSVAEEAAEDFLRQRKQLPL